MKEKILSHQTFIFLFNLLIFFTLISAIFYYYKTNQAIMRNFALQQHQEMASGIKEKITNYLNNPILVSEQNKLSIKKEYAKDIEKYHQYFDKQLVNQLITFPTVSQNFFGNNQSEFIGTFWHKIHEYPVIVYKKDLSQEAQYFQWNGKEKIRGKAIPPSSFSDTLPKKYDPKKRDWFTVKESGWSNIYGDLLSKEGVISYSSIVYNADNNSELLGVFGAEFFFSDTHQFLEKLAKPSTSAILLINKDRKLLSTSTKDPTSRAIKDKIHRLTIENTNNPLLKKIATKLDKTEDATKNNHHTFFFNGQRYMLQIYSIKKKSQLDWSIIFVTPEKYFIAEASKQHNKMLLVIALALFIALMMWTISIQLKKKYLD